MVAPLRSIQITPSHVLTTAKLDATGQRWVASLANYNFTITYHSGMHNVDADTLSRILWDIETTNKPILIKSALMRGIQGESSIPIVPPDDKSPIQSHASQR